MRDPILGAHPDAIIAASVILTEPWASATGLPMPWASRYGEPTILVKAVSIFHPPGVAKDSASMKTVAVDWARPEKVASRDNPRMENTRGDMVY